MVSHCPSSKKPKSLNKPAMCCMICPSLLPHLHQLLCLCSRFSSYFWPLVLPFPMPFPPQIVYLCLQCFAFSGFLFTITIFISTASNKYLLAITSGLPRCLSDKESACQCRRHDPWIPGSGRSPAGGKGNSLSCSCLENRMDRGAWQTTVHRLTKTRPQLSNEACIQACTTIICMMSHNYFCASQGPSFYVLFLQPRETAYFNS